MTIIEKSRSSNGQFQRAKELKYGNSVIHQIVDEEFDTFMTRLHGRIKEHYYQNNLSNVNLEADIETAIAYHFGVPEKSVLKIKKGPNIWNQFCSEHYQKRKTAPVNYEQLELKGNSHFQSL